MEIFTPLAPVIPVFLLIAAGFVFAHWKKINLTSVTEVIVYLGTPSLVFSSLAGGNRSSPVISACFPLASC